MAAGMEVTDKTDWGHVSPCIWEEISASQILQTDDGVYGSLMEKGNTIKRKGESKCWKGKKT